MRLRRGITLDSGAANNVMPRRMVRNTTKIRPSPGSRIGVHYVAANNARIPNEGETDFKFTTNEGMKTQFVFQIAEVNKALGAVSYMVDNRHKVVFDQDDNGRDMSYMVHKPTGDIFKLRRERNVCVLDAMIEDDDFENFDEFANKFANKASGFASQE